uniref:hypothetical protein n=1 Tax=Actinoplanes sp. CA-084688 TaxID=3239901 RepID=UPI003F49A4B9
MTDHTPQSPPPDLDTIADLMNASSLGSPDALLAQNEVDPQMAMKLRDKVYLDSIPREWDSIPMASIVLVQQGDSIYPDLDGSVYPTPAETIAGQQYFARNQRSGTVQEFRVGDKLPGGKARDWWDIWLAESGRRRSFLSHSVTTPEGMWIVEAAVLWQLKDPAEAIAASVQSDASGDSSINISTNGLLSASIGEELAAGRSEQLLSLKQQVRVEQRIVRELSKLGVAAECIIGVRQQSPPQQLDTEYPPSLIGEETPAARGVVDPPAGPPLRSTTQRTPDQTPPPRVTDRRSRTLPRDERDVPLPQEILLFLEQAIDAVLGTDIRRTSIEELPRLEDAFRRYLMEDEIRYGDSAMVADFVALVEVLRIYGMDVEEAEAVVTFSVEHTYKRFDRPNSDDIMKNLALSLHDLMESGRTQFRIPDDFRHTGRDSKYGRRPPRILPRLADDMIERREDRYAHSGV